MNLRASISVKPTGPERLKSFRKHMRLFIACLMLTNLLSCREDARVKKYQDIINHTDRLKIYTESGADLVLSREVSDAQELRKLKTMLTRNVRPSDDQKLFPYEKIELYTGNTLQGALLIFNSGGKPYADLKTPDFEFGFALTHGASFYLSQLR
jgi:hypothetical protein